MHLIANGYMETVDRFQNHVDLVNTLSDRNQKVECTIHYHSKRTNLFGHYLNPTKFNKTLPQLASRPTREYRFDEMYGRYGIPFKYVTDSTKLVFRNTENET